MSANHLIGPSDIGRLLPHRSPFVFIDAVAAYAPGESLTAMKAVSMSEPYFAGHFPGLPVMPGVLVIEALAQACAVFGALEQRAWKPGEAITDDVSPTIAALGSTRVAFRRPVFPGCVLELHVARASVSGRSSFFEVRAARNEEVCADGSIIVADLVAGSW